MHQLQQVVSKYHDSFGPFERSRCTYCAPNALRYLRGKLLEREWREGGEMRE